MLNGEGGPELGQLAPRLSVTEVTCSPQKTTVWWLHW